MTAILTEPPIQLLEGPEAQGPSPPLNENTVRPIRVVPSGTVIRIPPQHGGWLEVVCGPMFSGKSEEMIRRMRRAEIAGQRVGVFKPAIDARYDAVDVVSHAGARITARPVHDVADLVGLVDGLDVVGIDEAQFFPTSLVSAVQALAEEGRRVVLAGLDRDFRGLPFGPMPALLAVADLVDKLQAVCHS